MKTAIELSDVEEEIVKRRKADQTFAQIGREMNMQTQTAWATYQRVQKRMDRKRKIDAGYIDPSKSSWGGIRERVIELVDQNPGATTAEIAHALKRDPKEFSAQLSGLAKKGHVRRFKQDGKMRHYPKNYLKPTTPIRVHTSDVTIEPEVAAPSAIVQPDHVKWTEDKFMAYFMVSETPSLRGFLAYIKKENDDTTGTT